MNNALWMPLSLVAWALAWNRWVLPPSRTIDASALTLAALGIVVGAIGAASLTQVFRLGTLGLLLAIAVRIFRQGPMRGFALIVMLVIAISQYTSELGALGVPTIWFPFGIGVTLTQYVYGIAIPLLAVLIGQSLTVGELPPQAGVSGTGGVMGLWGGCRSALDGRREHNIHYAQCCIGLAQPLSAPHGTGWASGLAPACALRPRPRMRSRHD
ncbi:hypothetical protein [Stenotrophomonas sp. 57]|uniref:hypothetical protein n=1 Tax=Stenotrophomonas sp. 57 TaxID=3051119 RepID=UPI00256F07BB|nr:hypothetical protein [Stenotrophomonas sp. 57]